MTSKPEEDFMKHIAAVEEDEMIEDFFGKPKSAKIKSDLFAPEVAEKKSLGSTEKNFDSPVQAATESDKTRKELFSIHESKEGVSPLSNNL